MNKKKELDNSEENYCVNTYRNVKLTDDDLNNLEFGNDCKVRTNYCGDGFHFNLKYVKKIFFCQNENRIIVLFKGSKFNDYVDCKTIWNNDTEP
jgi:hypothetical protein